MKFKFAIIGCGHIGNRHAKHILAHPNAELVAAFDIEAEKSRNFGKQFHCNSIANLDEIFQMDIDMINICTPNGNHHSIAIDCLNAGKNVLVEKPMTIKKSFGEDMIKAALDNGKKLFVVKQNRFNPPVQAVKKLKDSGQLGKIYSIVVNAFWNRNEQYYTQSNWRGSLEMDGGTLFTQFSHFIDILYYLFGDLKVVSAIAQNANHQNLIEFEDTGHFLFEMKALNKTIGSFNYTTSAFDSNMEGSITVFAENATIKIGGQYLNTIEYQNIKNHEIVLANDNSKPNDYGFYIGSMSNHDQVIHNVIESLQGKAKIMTNAYDGLKVVEIIEEVYAVMKKAEMRR